MKVKNVFVWIPPFLMLQHPARFWMFSLKKKHVWYYWGLFQMWKCGPSQPDNPPVWVSSTGLKLSPSQKHISRSSAATGPPNCHRFLCFVPPAAAFLTQTVCLDDTTVKFEIWDTAGQERYHSLAPMYYRGAQAAIVVYDITNEVSQVPGPLLSCGR